MKKKLQDIATLRSGFSTRRPLETTQEGGIPVIQIKDLSPDGVLDDKQLSRVLVDSTPQHHIMKRGEILFAARGSSHRAGVFDSPVQSAIASGQFLVIHVNDPARILPEYLSWFLNSDLVMKALNAQTLGATIPHVSIAMLNEIEVEIPPVPVQKQIVALHNLCLQELAKLKELTEEKKKLSKQLPLSILKTFQKEQDHG